MWKINGEWVCSTPERFPCKPPRKLRPMTPMFNASVDLKTLGKGVYSKSQMENFQRFMDSISGGRQVVSSISETYASGESISSFSFASTLRWPYLPLIQ